MPNKENSACDQTKQAVDGAYKNARGKVEQAKDATKDTMKAASDKAGSLADGIKGTAQGLADSKPCQAAKDAMHSAGQAISNATK